MQREMAAAHGTIPGVRNNRRYLRAPHFDFFSSRSRGCCLSNLIPFLQRLSRRSALHETFFGGYLLVRPTRHNLRHRIGRGLICFREQLVGPITNRTLPQPRRDVKRILSSVARTSWKNRQWSLRHLPPRWQPFDLWRMGYLRSHP